jgi:FAD:protein FMN transferase
MKNFYTLILLLLLAACSEKEKLHRIEGPTMGTTYHIVYAGEKQAQLAVGIDSVLQSVNASLSTYIPTSTISLFNQSESGGQVDEPLWINFSRSLEIWAHTNGAFDPTVGPLVNAWGFGFEKMREQVDSALIDSRLMLVGLDKLKLEGDRLWKPTAAMQLDFSAIAKGYGVDCVAQYLESQGVANYIVEIGGELRAAGKKAPGFSWIAGIEKPIEDPSGTQRSLQMSLPLDDRSMATSGNYRNFYEKDGQKFSHTIHPATGYPARSNLLSATVVAANCMTADAYATAFMVMGFEDARALIENSDLEAVLLYSDENGELQQYISSGLEALIKQ